MTFVEAAWLPVAWMTAWHALVAAGRVQAGETVLVNAAGIGRVDRDRAVRRGRGSHGDQHGRRRRTRSPRP